jgi:disulfide bond formation protein DsbB
MAGLYLAAATLNVWVLALVLTAAFAVQLVSGELPCPLCVMQRVARMLVALGPTHVLLRARGGVLTARDVAIGNGMAIVAALVGATASGRQMLLHILPGDAGYGAPVLGLHLYTWCFVAFVCQIAASAVMLLTAVWLEDKAAPIPERSIGVTTIAFAVIVVANLGSVIAEAGLNWDLPENPVRYLLFG